MGSKCFKVLTNADVSPPIHLPAKPKPKQIRQPDDPAFAASNFTNVVSGMFTPRRPDNVPESMIWHVPDTERDCACPTGGNEATTRHRVHLPIQGLRHPAFEALPRR
jgi:hypothetical protein